MDFNLPSDIFRSQKLPSDSILPLYFFYDKLKQQEVFAPVTGNPGSASFIFFEENSTDQLFSDGFRQFTPYLLSPLKVFPIENVDRRYSNISYHIGSKKEQHIFIKHEQKIKPWMIAGLDFGALSSPGDFARTLNSNRNFDAYFGYEARSGVYRGYISFTSNLVENEENGGISSDTTFENASSLNTRTLPINLSQATMKHRSRDYMLKQELNLTRLFQAQDSASNRKGFNSGSIILSNSVWWRRKATLFTSLNPNPAYFTNTYFDTVATHDSTFYNDVYQVSMLEYHSEISDAGSSFNLGAGFEYQQNEYETGVTDEDDFLPGKANYSANTGAVVLAAGFDSQKLSAYLFYSRVVNGDYSDAFRSRFMMSYATGKTSTLIYFKAGAAKMIPSVHDLLYQSNHFIWKNNFSLIEQYDLSGGISLPRFKLNVEGRARISSNIIFYREDYLPQQFSEFVSVNELAVSKTFNVSKFGMDNEIVLSSTGNDQVAPVPPVSLFSSIYYQNRFFKQVLGFKAGFDVRYFSEYYGYGYMPATGVFYVQDDKKIGNSPLVGVFINLKIKNKATLFIRLDHANAGIGERTYYGAYHYPVPGRTFKFGVNWDLVD